MNSKLENGMAKEKQQKMIKTSLSKVVQEKLVSDNAYIEKKETQQIDSSEIFKISKHTENAISNADSILDLFPDVEISMQILISSILSPKDLITVKLTYENDTFEIPSTVLHNLNDLLSKHVNDNYKLEDNLYKILEESIFKKGAYIEAFIPENTLEKVMFKDEETSLESFTSHIDTDIYNTFGDKEKRYTAGSFEALLIKDINESLSFSDNPALLNASNMYMNNETKKTEVEIATEGRGLTPEKKTKMNDISNIFKRVPVNKNAEIVTLTTAIDGERKPLGVPLIMKLPIESVIPLITKNDPEKHLGYFVLLDETGQPLTETMSLKSEEDILKEKYFANSILKKAANNRFKLTGKPPSLKNSEDLVYNIIDEKIRSKLEKGNIKDLVDFENIQQIYGTMFRRVLTKQKTKLLYLPKELVSYIAFRYKSNGVGKSLMEKIGVLSSMRAILLITRLNSTVKNNSTTTKVIAKLDEHDANPAKSMERIVSEAMATRATQFPLGVDKLEDLVSWSHRAGFFFEFDHPSLPNMTIETEEQTTDHKEPEGILDEELKKATTMSFGLTPEMVENGFDANFASTVIANNALLAKRVMEDRKKFIPQLTQYVKKLTLSDYKIRKDLKTIIENNISEIKSSLSIESKKELNVKNITDNDLVEYFLEEYLSTIKANLPKVELYEDDSLGDAFKAYKDNIEDYVEIFFSEEALPEELVGKFEGKTDSLRMAIINTLLRRWMHENGYMTELLDLFSLDKYGNQKINPLEDFNTYVSNIEEGIDSYFKKSKKVKKKLDNTVDKFEEEEQEENLSSDEGGETLGKDEEEGDETLGKDEEEGDEI